MDHGLANGARADDSVELTTRFSGRELSEWSPSSVPVAITPLEFDIQAVSFAEGFGRALSALIGQDVQVAVHAQDGALFSSLTGGGSGDSRRYAPWEMPDLRQVWRRTVRPATERHERFFASADATYPAEVADVLRQATDRMTSMTYQHHTLVLPARLAVAEFCDLATSESVVPGELGALVLLAGRANATTRMAAHLWTHRQNVERVPPLAQEGEGYGIAHAGWLESREISLRLAKLYSRCAHTRSPRRLLDQTSRERRRRWAAAQPTLAAMSPTVRERFSSIHDRARRAAWLTEGHAPLMHARLTHAMRQLVHRLGRRLVDLDFIDHPDDLLYLRIRDIGQLTPREARERVSQYRMECAQFTPPLAAPGRPPNGNDALGSSRVARRIRQVLGYAPAPHDEPNGGIVGYPAAPGRARGRLRFLVRQADLAKVEPGDVIVAADSGAVWSYAAPAASAFIAVTGNIFGHLPSLARDYGMPCVVGTGLLPGIREGQHAEVDGDAGIIKYGSDRL